MATYQYTAMDAGGKEKKGEMDAASEDAVAASLKEQGMFPTSIKLVKGGKGKTAKKGGAKKKEGGFNMNIQLGPMVIKTADLTVLTRQLAILLDAGLPLIRSLRTLEKQAKNPAIQVTLSKTADSVESGSTFSEALAQHPKSFDKLYLNMVRAGEAAGAMEVILTRLAEFMEKAARIAGKVKSAMIYPIVVLSIACIITMGLMIFIVPKFQKIFSDMLGDEPLPALTNFIMTVSQMLQSGLGILKGSGIPFIEYVEGPLEMMIAAVIVFFTVKFIYKTEKGRYAIDYMLYNMPLFGPIISKSSISKFSRTLGTLMGAGVPVLNALSIVKETSGNEVVASAVQKVHDAVKEGEGMAEPLGATKIFPDMVISMIEVGEETGKLPEMLEKIANTYDEEVDNAVGGLTSMIEPLMIVGLAVIVGTIVISLFMPLIKIMDKLGQ